MHQPQALGEKFTTMLSLFTTCKEPLEGIGSYSRLVFAELCAKDFNWAGFFFSLKKSFCGNITLVEPYEIANIQPVFMVVQRWQFHVIQHKYIQENIQIKRYMTQ